jgi:hypothetical protein
MKRSLKIFPLILISNLVFAQFYFPLQVGNNWNFNSSGGYPNCEGNFFVASIIRDSTINSKLYFMTQGLFPSRFVRQEGSLFYAFDTLDTEEYVLFDFSAQQGDTISIRDAHTKIIVAQGNEVFVQFDNNQPDQFKVSSWALRDSFGVVSIGGYCAYVCHTANINGNSVTLGIENNSPRTLIPTSLILKQNFPNPFNPTTHIEFAIPTEGRVTLNIFDILGRSISTLIDTHLSAGWHSVTWDASNIPSGQYFYRLDVGKSSLLKSLVVLK